MKLSRQSRLVLDHLRANPHLTSWQAEGVYRIRRLASRVDELRAAGFEIVTSPMTDATGQRYTRYALSKRQRRAKNPLLPKREAPQQYRIDTIEDAYFDYCMADLGMASGEAREETDAFIKYLKEFNA